MTAKITIKVEDGYALQVYQGYNPSVSVAAHNKNEAEFSLTDSMEGNFRIVASKIAEEPAHDHNQDVVEVKKDLVSPQAPVVKETTVFHPKDPPKGQVTGPVGGADGMRSTADKPK